MLPLRLILRGLVEEMFCVLSAHASLRRPATDDSVHWRAGVVSAAGGDVHVGVGVGVPVGVQIDAFTDFTGAVLCCAVP